jgi:DNA-directed RNA polymerase specialized sigma24 family protein
MNKLDPDAVIRALRAAALEDLEATSDVELALEAAADGEQIDVIAARNRSIMLSAAATALRRHRSASDSRCENLSARSFEQRVRALALELIGPHVAEFADGFGGNREATFDARVAHCDGTSGWAGKGVLQLQFQPATSEPLDDDATWLTDLLDRALGQYRRDGNRLYHPNGTVELIEEPRYYVLITNVVLDSAAGMRAKDKVISRLEDYRQKLGWVDFDLWDGAKISSLSCDSDAIHDKVGYKTQFRREHEAVSSEAPSLGEFRGVAVSGECATEPESSDVCACPYIHDEELPDELLRRVRACAWAITHDPEAAKDIEQQVKLRLSTMDRERWNQITHKWGYVIGMARNESRTWLRLEAQQPGGVMSRQPHELERKPMERAAPDWDIKRLLEPFSRECAEAFYRVCVLGRPVRTVALEMKLSMSRVRAHVDTASRYNPKRLRRRHG